VADIILTQEDADRFWAKTSRNAETGCLEWTAAKNKTGYGWFGKNHTGLLAHRVAWALSGATIPTGSSVLHRCDNPSCVEVGHMFLGTAADNVADMIEKKRHRSQKATHCPKGHAYSGENLYVKRDGTRDCRACQKVRNAAWKKAHSRTRTA